MHHSEQVNAGHRNRMRQKFILQGARPFLAHEILEMLLFSAIPYKDTNPLAHLLMDRFGSLDSVLEAPVDDLLSVPGMGIHTATFLRLVNEVGRRALYQPVKTSPGCYGDYRSLGEYLVSKTDLGAPTPPVRALLFNNRYDLLASVTMDAPQVTAPAFSLKNLARCALRHDATLLALVTNHEGRSAFPTPEEVDITKEIQVSLKMLGITLLEHYILSGSHYVGVSRRILNGFEDNPDLCTFFRDAPDFPEEPV